MSTKKSNSKISKDHPELIDVIVDFAIFTRKYQAPDLAKIIGISKQGLEYHINKKTKKEKKNAK